MTDEVSICCLNAASSSPVSRLLFPLYTRPLQWLNYKISLRPCGVMDCSMTSRQLSCTVIYEGHLVLYIYPLGSGAGRSRSFCPLSTRFFVFVVTAAVAAALSFCLHISIGSPHSFLSSNQQVRIHVLVPSQPRRAIIDSARRGIESCAYSRLDPVNTQSHPSQPDIERCRSRKSKRHTSKQRNLAATPWE